MKKYWKYVSSALLAMVLMAAPLHAEEADGTIGLTFEGESSEFITYDEGSAYEDMTPGEERVQKITLTNQDYREMKFYVRSDYAQPLGEGKANEEIAYDIEFLNNGNAFYTGQIGGVTKANMDSLDENYLLKTLKKGESTTIEMKIKIDGDSMDNSYQGTIGNLNLVFSVEYEENNPIIKVIKQVEKIPVLNKIINTGDTTKAGLILGVFAVSIVVIIILIIRKIKKRKGGNHE